MAMTRCFRVVDLRVSIFIFLILFVLVSFSLHVRLRCASETFKLAHVVWTRVLGATTDGDLLVPFLFVHTFIHSYVYVCEISRSRTESQGGVVVTVSAQTHEGVRYLAR